MLSWTPSLLALRITRTAHPPLAARLLWVLMTGFCTVAAVAQNEPQPGPETGVHYGAKPAQNIDTDQLQPGLGMKVFDIGEKMTRLFELAEGQLPNAVRQPKGISYAAKDFCGYEKLFIAEITGYLQAPVNGAYTIRLECDDGAAVWIGGKRVVIDDGLHLMRPRDGKVHLKKGFYPIRVLYFQNVGKAGLRLSWRTPDAEGLVLIPRKTYFTQAVAAETAPGLKQLGEPVSAVAPPVPNK